MKAESDILCTSRNAVKIVNSIPADKPILFLPDRNLGNYVKQQTGRENMKIWQGACIVHETFPVRRLLDAKAAFPDALVVAHPECPEAVLRHADFIGSTSAIIEYCAASPAREFIVMTESGVNFSLERVAPDKEVPLRQERELQLQRMPVHAPEYARETARRAAESGATGRTCRRHHAPRAHSD